MQAEVIFTRRVSCFEHLDVRASAEVLSCSSDHDGLDLWVETSAEDRVIERMASETDEGRIARQNAHEKLATVLAQQSRDELMKGPLVPVWLKVNVNLGEGKRNKVMKHERVVDAEGRVTSGFVGEPVLVPVDVARKLLDGNKAERADPLPGED